jgi:hypothetical protein
MSECNICNDTGTVLVKCYSHGDISHAEQCLCQYETDFMETHGVNEFMTEEE